MATGFDQESVSTDPPNPPPPQRFTHTDRHAEAFSLRDAARRSPVTPDSIKELRIVIPSLLVNTRGGKRGRDDVDF